MMKTVRILHNANAGDEEHSEEEIIDVIKAEGFNCEYFSISDSKWDKIDPEVEFLAVAGGDGTVRKVAKKLLDRKLVERRFPLAILPLGTANNLANSLRISSQPREIVETWKQPTLKGFDIGLIEGIKEGQFFLEGLGYGVFPELMSRMKKIEDKFKDTPEKKLAAALVILEQVVESYPPDSYIIEADGVQFSGSYLLVEIMNTKTIGPNLLLSAAADPGDGLFDLVLIPEEDKAKLSQYIRHKIQGEELSVDFNPVKCRNVKIVCNSKKLHIDDELIKLKQFTEVGVRMQESLLQFLV